VGLQLQSQYLAEVLAALNGRARAGGGAEKRRAPRIAVEARVVIWPVDGGAAGPGRTVLIRDVSHSGMGILSTRLLNPEQRVIAQLPRAKGEPLLVLCRVTLCRPLADDLFAVGFEFVSFVARRDSPGGVPDDARYAQSGGAVGTPAGTGSPGAAVTQNGAGEQR
jgi:hypothetical protein